MKLAIFSHTRHYRRGDNIVGWSPTIREINHLLEVFDEIWHVAVLEEGAAPKSALPYASPRVHFVPLKPTGGQRIGDKLNIIRDVPETIRKIGHVLQQVDCFQFRAPTGIGVYLIPYLSAFSRKPGWYKYAGNWRQDKPPLAYAWQRFWLEKLQKRKLTINGRWPGQPGHALSFENPCLNQKEREEGWRCLQQKDYRLPLTACFVGALADRKGVARILEALGAFPKEKLAAMHFVGDGPDRARYEAWAAELSIPCHFHGFQDHDGVTRVMQQSHLLLLPSNSEGFPKVVAEGWNYGCVPVVSDVSSISQYVGTHNGYLWDLQGSQRFDCFFGELKLDEISLRDKAVAGYREAEKFTFEYYNLRIFRDVLGREPQGTQTAV